MSIIATFIQHSIRSSNRSNSRRKGGIHTGREVKLPIYANYIILHIKNPKDSTKKLLELINSVKLEYKIDRQKSFNNKLITKYQKEKLRKQFHLSKRIKYPGIYLTKEIKELYSKNWKTLMKEAEDNTNGKIS